jgi:hypothetical protein
MFAPKVPAAEQESAEPSYPEEFFDGFAPPIGSNEYLPRGGRLPETTDANANEKLLDIYTPVLDEQAATGFAPARAVARECVDSAVNDNQCSQGIAPPSAVTADLSSSFSQEQTTASTLYPAGTEVDTFAWAPAASATESYAPPLPPPRGADIYQSESQLDIQGPIVEDRLPETAGSAARTKSRDVYSPTTDEQMACTFAPTRSVALERVYTVVNDSPFPQVFGSLSAVSAEVSASFSQEQTTASNLGAADTDVDSFAWAPAAPAPDSLSPPQLPPPNVDVGQSEYQWDIQGPVVEEAAPSRELEVSQLQGSGGHDQFEDFVPQLATDQGSCAPTGKYHDGEEADVSMVPQQSSSPPLSSAPQTLTPSSAPQTLTPSSAPEPPSTLILPSQLWSSPAPRPMTSDVSSPPIVVDEASAELPPVLPPPVSPRTEHIVYAPFPDYANQIQSQASAHVPLPSHDFADEMSYKSFAPSPRENPAPLSPPRGGYADNSLYLYAGPGPIQASSQSVESAYVPEMQSRAYDESYVYAYGGHEGASVPQQHAWEQDSGEAQEQSAQMRAVDSYRNESTGDEDVLRLPDRDSPYQPYPDSDLAPPAPQHTGFDIRQIDDGRAGMGPFPPPPPRVTDSAPHAGNAEYVHISDNSSVLAFMDNGVPASLHENPPRCAISWGFGGQLLAVKSGKADDFDVGSVSLQSSGYTYGNSGAEPAKPRPVYIYHMATTARDSADDNWIAAHAAISYTDSSTTGRGSKSMIDEYALMCDRLAATSAGQLPRTVESRAALWRVLAMLCRHPTSAEWRREASSALAGPSAVRLYSQSNVSSSNLSTSAVSPLAPLAVDYSLPKEQVGDAAAEVEQLLASGRVREAVDRAQKASLWSLALIAAAQVDRGLYLEIMSSFACQTLVDGSALQTLCLTMAGKITDVIHRATSPQGMDKWRKTVAVLLGIRGPDSSNSDRVIAQMGDAMLQEKGDVVGAHLCYLLSGRVPRLGAQGSEVTLLGASGTVCAGRSQSHGSSAAVLQSLVYEAVCKARGQTGFMHMLPMRLILAQEMASVGRPRAALTHCESIIQAVRATFESGDHAASTALTPPFLACLEELDHLLRAHIGLTAPSLPAEQLLARLRPSISKVFQRAANVGRVTAPATSATSASTVETTPSFAPHAPSMQPAAHVPYFPSSPSLDSLTPTPPISSMLELPPLTEGSSRWTGATSSLVARAIDALAPEHMSESPPPVSYGQGEWMEPLMQPDSLSIGASGAYDGTPQDHHGQQFIPTPFGQQQQQPQNYPQKQHLQSYNPQSLYAGGQQQQGQFGASLLPPPPPEKLTPVASTAPRAAAANSKPPLPPKGDTKASDSIG